MRHLIISTILVVLSSFKLFAFDTIELKRIKGEPLKISDYKNRVVLVVNIATRCGLTGQLDDLEKLYQNYKEQGLVVIGIPSNDFMGQTPEGNEEVADFCRLKYGVSFPLIKKMVVKGDDKSKFYQELLKASPRSDEEIAWNFEKFLISKHSKVVGRFAPKTAPLGGELEEKIKELVR